MIRPAGRPAGVLLPLSTHEHMTMACRVRAHPPPAPYARVPGLRCLFPALPASLTATPGAEILPVALSSLGLALP